MIRDNLHVIKTNNIEETIKVINSIYKDVKNSVKRYIIKLI